MGLVTEIFIPNYQPLFFKLTQLAQLSQKNLGKPRLLFLFRSHFHGNGTQQDSVIDVYKCGNFPVNSFKLMVHVL